MTFPEHLALHLRHNDHKSSYMTVAEYCDTMDAGPDVWVSEEQRLKAIETNELWELQWYPDTPIGFRLKMACDLDALLGWSRGYRVLEILQEADAPRAGLPESPRSGR